ncbi:outer membrane lipoprotein-sorting protein [bacterium]|nr:outer membrane lipoprotein-sorting protein [bacterium]
MKRLNGILGGVGLFIAAISLAVFMPSMAVSEGLTAFEIMKKVDKRDDGETSISEMTMILIDRKGNQRIKIMKGFRKDFGEDTKTISFFLSPEDERNVSFLSYEWEDESKEDDNWLYLPALGRPKRISGSGKKGSFMGSDFSYADMNGLELGDWDFKIVQESAMVKDQDCWIIEAVPKASKREKVSDETGYKKTISWVRKDIFMTIQSRLYLEKGGKYKNFIASDIEKIQGIWTAKKLSMIQLKGKTVEHSTVLQFDSLEYNKGVEDNMFTVQRMVRGL